MPLHWVIFCRKPFKSPKPPVVVGSFLLVSSVLRRIYLPKHPLNLNPQSWGYSSRSIVSTDESVCLTWFIWVWISRTSRMLQISNFQNELVKATVNSLKDIDFLIGLCKDHLPHIPEAAVVIKVSDCILLDITGTIENPRFPPKWRLFGLFYSTKQTILRCLYLQIYFY